MPPSPFCVVRIHEAVHGVDIRRWTSDNDLVAIRAVALDDQNTQHLIIGLNRDNINSLLDGDVFTLPRGIAIDITQLEKVKASHCTFQC